MIKTFLVINVLMSCDTSISEHSFWQLRSAGLYKPVLCKRFSGSTLEIDCSVFATQTIPSNLEEEAPQNDGMRSITP